jgi:hypothetical protein
MITKLPVSIYVAGPIMEKLMPRFVLFRTEDGDIVVEAYCCDTPEENQEIINSMKMKPGTIETSDALHGTTNPR